jgi:hypothetical protein
MQERDEREVAGRLAKVADRLDRIQADQGRRTQSRADRRAAFSRRVVGLVDLYRGEDPGEANEERRFWDYKSLAIALLREIRDFVAGEEAAEAPLAGGTPPGQARPGEA